MSQFGGSTKNPPWSSLGGGTGAHQQMLQAQMMGLGNPASAAAGLYNQQMAAAAAAGSNSFAVQAQLQANAMQAQAMQTSANVVNVQQGHSINQQKQRVFTGTVTKLHDTFGFVDEDVFFQTSTVKGVMPKVSERVLVEATFNPNMPFKWNATRVQLLPNQANQVSNLQQQATGLGAQVNPMLAQQGLINPPPLMGMPVGNQQQGILGNPPRSALQNLAASRQDQHMGRRKRVEPKRNREAREREQHERDARDRKRDQRERDAKDERREREKEMDKGRDRSPPTSARHRSRSPRRSPKRNRKPTPRYVVQVPKFPLNICEANVLTLKKRYTNLYIPSDFFLANCCYQDAFPVGREVSFKRDCKYLIMPREVEPPKQMTSDLEPPDASYLYSAKVMLLASQADEELFRNCCARVEDPAEIRDSFQHPARILSFLVGSKGKNEVMAIGGPWSPSLDGPDPANDDGVLIRTAIRTTRALTGVDLSSCGKWYRFLEIHYHRGDQTHKGRSKPRVETVVIFFPDIWNLVPTKNEWESLAQSYKEKFATKHMGKKPEEKEPAVSPPASDSPATQVKEEPKKDEIDLKNNREVEEEGITEVKEGNNAESVEEGKEDQQLKSPTPTNWRQLDAKNMKVTELRTELETRGLSSKGLKSQLVTRLVKCLKKEQEDEEAVKDGGDDNGEETKAEPEEMQTEDVPKAEDETKDAPDEIVMGEDSQDEVVGEEGSEEEEAPEEQKGEKTDRTEGEKTQEEGEGEKVDVIDKKEEEERARKAERELQVLERKYTLPDTPAILVHPSTSAKGGKFDCSVTNLSVLLDYRPEDTKEHSFEVSLFAELFNELLQRDFAFKIYQALLKAPEKKEEKKEDKKKEKKEDKKDEKKEEETEEPATKKKKIEEADLKEEVKTEEKKEEKKEDNKEEAKPDAPKEGDVKPSTIPPVQDEMKKEEKKDKEKSSKQGHRSSSTENIPKGKLETLHPDLLLSCVYFDQNHCGYLLDKDLEDIFNCLGLNLSRAQVKKLLQKVLSRDSWHYRKLTDGVRLLKEKEAGAVVKVEVNGQLEDCIKGNLGIFEAARTKRGGSKGKQEGSESTSNLVYYKGAVIDLPSLIGRVERSELQLKLAETKIDELEKESEKLKALTVSSQESAKNLGSEVDTLKKKLHDTEDSLRSVRRKNNDFRSLVEKSHKSLEDVTSRMKQALEREKEEKKDKDAKEQRVAVDKK